ncbi:MAG: hypothetical protein RLY71_3058 [Pseudomonadota bacterium]|jgi:uncharacterized protein YidB (DUF937 family)
MGLFDSVVGAALGGGQGGLGGGLGGALLGALGQSGNTGALLQVATSLLGENSGGLPGLIQKFQQSGLGDVAMSWIASGNNLPISGEQISQVLGSPVVGQLAQAMGVGHEEAGNQLAQFLPMVVDALTPDGQMPAADAQLPIGQIATQMLGKFMGQA